MEAIATIRVLARSMSSRQALAASALFKQHMVPACEGSEQLARSFFGRWFEAFEALPNPEGFTRINTLFQDISVDVIKRAMGLEAVSLSEFSSAWVMPGR